MSICTKPKHLARFDTRPVDTSPHQKATNVIHYMVSKHTVSVPLIDIERIQSICKKGKEQKPHKGEIILSLASALIGATASGWISGITIQNPLKYYLVLYACPLIALALFTCYIILQDRNSTRERLWNEQILSILDYPDDLIRNKGHEYTINQLQPIEIDPVNVYNESLNDGQLGSLKKLGENNDE